MTKGRVCVRGRQREQKRERKAEIKRQIERETDRERNRMEKTERISVKIAKSIRIAH